MGEAEIEQGLVVVTGGSRGIGAAVSALAARRGYSVLVNYSGDAKAAEDVVRRIEGDDGAQGRLGR